MNHAAERATVTNFGAILCVITVTLTYYCIRLTVFECVQMQGLAKPRHHCDAHMHKRHVLNNLLTISGYMMRGVQQVTLYYLRVVCIKESNLRIHTDM